MPDIPATGRNTGGVIEPGTAVYVPIPSSAKDEAKFSPQWLCWDIRRLSPAEQRWLYDWMGDTFDLQERP